MATEQKMSIRHAYNLQCLMLKKQKKKMPITFDKWRAIHQQDYNNLDNNQLKTVYLNND